MGEENRFFFSDNKIFTKLFQVIVSEGKKWVNANRGCLYFFNSNGVLIGNNELKNPEQAEKIAYYTLENVENLLLKKGSLIPGTSISVNESYISCYVGDKERNNLIGVFVLEGINNFDSFSKEDFELISVYSQNIYLLLHDSLYFEDLNEIYLKFATSLMILLTGTENYRENKKLDFLLKEIIRVTGIINSSHHLSKLLRELMESVKSVFRTESCSILLVDKEKNDLYFHTIAGEKEEDLSKVRVPMGQGIAGTVAITKTPMIINDAQNDNRVYKVADQTSGFVTRNILATPLVVDDEVIGVMEGINTIDRNNFNESDIDIFLTFSEAAAVAIQKARLVDDLQKANRELEKKVSELASLFDLGQAVLESKDVKELSLKSIRIIVRELDARRAVIILKDPSKQNLNLISHVQGKEEISTANFLRESVIVHAIIDNRIVLKKEVPIYQELDDLDEVFLVGSYIILPISDSNKRPFGAICISERNDKTAFNQGHLRLLQTISAQYIKGYENIRLNEDIIAKKAMEKEIEITSNIQKNILPGGVPGGSNFTFGKKFMPAKEVSGDFYDFYKYADGQFAFLIADVSGKSLPAAIFMAMSSSVIRTLSRDHKLKPSDLLAQANNLIYEDSESGMFVTLFFFHYNPANSQIDYASAGHNDQIWIKKDGTYELIKGKGAPLGVLPNGKYEGGSIIPSDGDIFVLYTDGAIEEENESHEEYGLERFVDDIIKRRDLHPQTIAEEVYETIMKFSGSNDQFDDFTLLIFKFNNDFQFSKSFKAENKQIPLLRDFVYDAIKVRKLNDILRDDILLCCDEAATNIVMHSYEGINIKNPIFTCSVKFTDNSVQILLEDNGKSFERDNVQKPSLEANIKGERKGGFGVYLIEKLMDKVEYQRKSDKNLLFLEKKIPAVYNTKS